MQPLYLSHQMIPTDWRGNFTVGKGPSCKMRKTAVQVQVVKSDSATVTVPELEFEIPMGTQKGTITTVEGMLREAGDALRALQPQRAQQDPETAAAISQFLGESTAMLPP